MMIQCILIINPGTCKLLLALAQPCFEINVHQYESKKVFWYEKIKKKNKNYNTWRHVFETIL